MSCCFRIVPSWLGFFCVLILFLTGCDSSETASTSKQVKWPEDEEAAREKKDSAQAEQSGSPKLITDPHGELSKIDPRKIHFGGARWGIENEFVVTDSDFKLELFTPNRTTSLQKFSPVLAPLLTLEHLRSDGRNIQWLNDYPDRNIKLLHEFGFNFEKTPPIVSYIIVMSLNGSSMWTSFRDLSLELKTLSADAGDVILTRSLDGPGLVYGVVIEGGEAPTVLIEGQEKQLGPTSFTIVNPEESYDEGRRVLYSPWYTREPPHEHDGYESFDELPPLPIGFTNQMVIHQNEEYAYLMNEDYEMIQVSWDHTWPMPLLPSLETGDQVWVLPTRFYPWKDTKIAEVKKELKDPWEVDEVDEKTHQVQLRRASDPDETTTVPRWMVLSQRVWADIAELDEQDDDAGGSAED